MGPNLFKGCSSLTSVTLPFSVSELFVNDDVFTYCTSLTEVTIPSNILKLYVASNSFGIVPIKLLNENTLTIIQNSTQKVHYTMENVDAVIKNFTNVTEAIFEINSATKFTITNGVSLSFNVIDPSHHMYSVDNIKMTINDTTHTLEVLNSTKESKIDKLTTDNISVIVESQLNINNIMLKNTIINEIESLDNLLSKTTRTAELTNVKTKDNTDNTEKTVIVVEMVNKDSNTSKVYGIVLNNKELFKLLYTDLTRSIELQSAITKLMSKSFQYANVEKLYIADDKEVSIEENAFNTLNNTGNEYIFNTTLTEIYLSSKSLTAVNNSLNTSYNFGTSGKIVLDMENNEDFGAKGKEGQKLTLICTGDLPSEFGDNSGNALTLILKLDPSANDITLHIPIPIDNYGIIKKTTYTEFEGHDLKAGDIKENTIIGVYIPISALEIDHEAFEDCVNMENLDFKLNYMDVSEVHTLNIDVRAFKNCSKLESVKFPSNLETINAYAFENCNKLNSIILGMSMDYIHETAFFDVRPYIPFYLDNGEPNYAYDEDGEPIGMLVNIKKTDSLITIYTNDVINNNLNSGSDTNMDFYRDNVSFYGIQYAYTNFVCLLNKKVIPSDSTDVTLTDVTLTESIVKQYAFLASHIIVEEYTSINYDSFKGFCLLEKIELSETCTSLESSIFSDCYKLKEVTLSDSIQTFPNNVFYHCYNLTKINQNKIKNIYRPDDTTTDSTTTDSTTDYIGVGAFSKCYLLDFKDFKINKVKSINDEAFEFCSKMESINMPLNLTSIGKDAFKDTSIMIVYIPRTVKNIGINAFKTPSLQTVGLGGIGGLDYLDDAKDKMFPIGQDKGFFGAKHVTIELLYDGNYYSSLPDASLVTNIHNDLKTLNNNVPSPKNRTGINEEKESINMNIINVKKIPENLLNSSMINPSNANGFPNITLGIINIPDATHIGKRAFYSNYTMKLKDDKLPPNLIEVGDEAFENCYSLNVTNICDLRGKVGKTEGYQAFKDTPVEKTVCPNNQQTKSLSKVQSIEENRNTIIPLNRVNRRSTKSLKFT